MGCSAYLFRGIMFGIYEPTIRPFEDGEELGNILQDLYDAESGLKDEKTVFRSGLSRRYPWIMQWRPKGMGPR